MKTEMNYLLVAIIALVITISGAEARSGRDCLSPHIHQMERNYGRGEVVWAGSSLYAEKAGVQLQCFDGNVAVTLRNFKTDKPSRMDINDLSALVTYIYKLHLLSTLEKINKCLKNATAKTSPIEHAGWTNVDHSMSVMMDESFGPVVGIMKVSGDEEAVKLMNDSPFGLTASIWTSDVNAARAIGEDIDTGTVFMNRCDYLDPALAWTGCKDTGRGCTLSAIGYEALTRPKSFHLRLL